jgi:hypothetical protein
MRGRHEECIQLVREPEGKRQLERSVIDGRIILEWIVEKYGGNV